MNDDMYTNEIPNRMLYDLIMEMKHEFRAELSEFKQEIQRNFARLETKIDSNAARLDAKIDNLETRLDAKIEASTARLEAKIDKNTELVNQLYQRGDKLELSFSRKILLGNSALAGVVAFFVALFTGRMIVEN